jgi:HAE1 family hydrophobic/amphiphilic exporter-1
MSIATGPSAQGNHSISIAAAGGMVSGVLLGIFIIPVLFVIFQHLQERVTGMPLAVLNNGEHHTGEHLNGNPVHAIEQETV